MNGVVRRRGMIDSKSLSQIAFTSTTDDYSAMLLTYLYNKGLCASTNNITVSECTAITSGLTDMPKLNVKLTWEIVCLQYFTNVPQMDIGNSSNIDKSSCFIVLPPNIAVNGYITRWYRFNKTPMTEETRNKFVFTSHNPRKFLGAGNDKYWYYSGNIAAYFPDDEYEEWVSLNTAYLNKTIDATTGYQGVVFRKISELSDDEKAKIKVVDINTLIN